MREENGIIKEKNLILAEVKKMMAFIRLRNI